jgi:hypothetical protein
MTREHRSIIEGSVVTLRWRTAMFRCLVWIFFIDDVYVKPIFFINTNMKTTFKIWKLFRNHIVPTLNCSGIPIFQNDIVQRGENLQRILEMR